MCLQSTSVYNPSGTSPRSSASSCADPRYSMSRDPRREEYTICTAIGLDSDDRQRRRCRQSEWAPWGSNPQPAD